MSDRLATRAEIAHRLGLSERQISSLVKSGQLDDGTEFPSRVEGRSRLFPEGRCFAWYIRYKQEEAVRKSAGPAKPKNGVERKEREAEIRLAMLELEFAERRREVVGKDAYRNEMRRVLGRIAAKARSVTGEFAPRILEPLDMPRAVKLMRELEHRIIAEFASAGVAAEELEPPATEGAA